MRFADIFTQLKKIAIPMRLDALDEAVVHRSKLKKYMHFVQGGSIDDVTMFDPRLVIILGHVANYCLEANLPFNITSTIRTAKQDKRLGATSKTHQEGRAFDISLNDWTREDVQKMVDFVQSNFYEWGAISASTGMPRAVVVHKNASNNGVHAHLQVKPR